MSGVPGQRPCRLAVMALWAANAAVRLRAESVSVAMRTASAA